MPNQRWTSGRWALGICDICSFRCKYLDLRMEPISAYGAPSNRPSGLKACPKCYDPPHAQSFLPIAVRQHGSDAEQLRQPRPDVFPKAFPITYLYPGAIYTNMNVDPIRLSRSSTVTIWANGIIGGYSATIPNPPAGITVNRVDLPANNRAIVNLTIGTMATVGRQLMAIQDGVGNTLNGLIEIV